MLRLQKGRERRGKGGPGVGFWFGGTEERVETGESVLRGRIKEQQKRGRRLRGGSLLPVCWV